MKKFEPKEFEHHSGQSQLATELREHLRASSIEERIEFIKAMWPLNFRFALSLTASSQIPIKRVSEMLAEWLLENKHNSARFIIEELEPLLGKERFWKVAASLELTKEMREFLNYHSGGKLKFYENG